MNLIEFIDLRLFMIYIDFIDCSGSNGVYLRSDQETKHKKQHLTIYEIINTIEHSRLYK